MCAHMRWVSAVWVCVCTYVSECMYVCCMGVHMYVYMVLVYSVCACVHVHAPSPSCRMSYCDPIYFLSASANTTNLYMYCYKSCLAIYCPMCVYCGCVVHVCIVLCILHCPSVAIHTSTPPPHTHMHTHFIPLCHMPCPIECPGTCS